MLKLTGNANKVLRHSMKNLLVWLKSRKQQKKLSKSLRFTSKKSFNLKKFLKSSQKKKVLQVKMTTKSKKARTKIQTRPRKSL